jgi:DnaJ-class molecular chaperone
MPKLRNRGAERGDLLARARIVTPTGISDRERALFQELRQLRPEKSS